MGTGPRALAVWGRVLWERLLGHAVHRREAFGVATAGFTLKCVIGFGFRGVRFLNATDIPQMWLVFDPLIVIGRSHGPGT